MKTLWIVLGLVLANGCARELRYKFVRTDQNFTPAPHDEAPKMLYDLKEIYSEPPYRSVGVLQVSGTQTKTIDDFLGQLTAAGAKLGCDALMQADLFEIEVRVPANNPVRNPAGVFWVAGEEGAWQFVCGVKGASDFEAARTYELALVSAAALRDGEMGLRVCDRTAPTGSHVNNMYVCAETKGLMGRAHGMSSMGGFGGGVGKGGN